MATVMKKYALADLKIGMHVAESQLNDIYDMHIVLLDTEIKENELHGKIGFIGAQLNEESDRLNQLNTAVADIYNRKSDAEDDVTYDE